MSVPKAPPPAGGLQSDSPESKLRRLIMLRDTVRVELHRQLDDLLALPAKDEPGDSGASILDSIVAEVSIGFGVQVSVQTRHPEQSGADPAPSAPPRPPIDIVR